ncbi:beta-class carbonic anhydrase [Streptomyces zagrosensis]|uniref:carbonic anhydrase n=1 Tax=Streptomyces zagrosensis TaxID=1042984 RepID=A0A7W9Q613_9ACTN|nr:carbonic anhydrase [Streptomyces zagrosensis]MBB5934210.1 carbonic anhydrase [Streptomyces zagrosensis]
MSVTDVYLANSETYAATASDAYATEPPSKRLAVIACMDARMDIYAMLGLKVGEAHVIRNAGGAVTDDAIRSLVVSQRELQTREVMLIHHTKCGMLGLSDDAFKREIQDETGIRPPWAVEGFERLEEDVRQSVLRVLVNPFVPHKDAVRGFIYDVDARSLYEVECEGLA